MAGDGMGVGQCWTGTWNTWDKSGCLPCCLSLICALSLGTVGEGTVSAQRALTSSLGSAPTGCVTVGKLLPLSEPQVRNEDHDAYFPSEYETRWMHLAQCLGCGRCLTIGGSSISLVPAQDKARVVYDSEFTVPSMTQFLLIKTAAICHLLTQALLWAC